MKNLAKAFTLVAALAATSASANVVCTGYVSAPGNPELSGNYTVAMYGNSAQVVLNGASYSLSQCNPTPHGSVCRETSLPAYVLSSDTPYGAQAGLSLSVDTGSQTIRLGRFTSCNY